MNHLQSLGVPFTFTPENQDKARAAMAQYPEGRQASAVKTLLYLAQDQLGGWICQEAVEYVATFLHMPFIRVYEVVTFYTLFRLKPIGRVHLEVCTTTPCWLRGADDLLHQCQRRAQEEPGLTVEEVECLGACVNAPVVKIQNDFFEDLDETSLNKLMDDALQGRSLKPGSNRLNSAPAHIHKDDKGAL